MRRSKFHLFLFSVFFLSSLSYSETIVDYLKFFSSLKSRIPGYEGNNKAASFIENKFKEIGLKNVKKEEFFTTIPVEKYAYLQKGKERIKIYSLWPNLVRTSSIPPEGFESCLIYGGKGDLKTLDGKDISNSIVVVDFDSDDNWTTLAMLGVKGFIFLNSGDITRKEAEKKFLRIPVNVPRFYADENSEKIKNLALKGEKVKLFAKVDWEKVPNFNIYGVVEGTDEKLKDEIIVLESYYDSISVVPSLAPGASSACGISTLLKLAEYFVKNPPKRTVIFLATSSHFESLKGIDDFIQRHSRNISPFSERIPDDEKILPKLFIGLELSDGSDELAIWHNSYDFYTQRFFAPFGKKFLSYSEKICAKYGYNPETALMNGISPEKGIIWQTFLPEPVRTDGEYMILSGNPAISLVTVNDGRWKVDTPIDTFENLNLGNIKKQYKFLKGVLSLAINDNELFPDTELELKDKVATLVPKVVTFNPRKSFVPNDPVPGALVVPRMYEVYENFYSMKTFTGVRGDIVEMTDEDGKANISRFQLGTRVFIYSFLLDKKTGKIVLATDLGVNGDQQYPIGTGLGCKIVEKTIVLFHCKSISIFGLIDPQYLVSLDKLDVFDLSNSTPDAYGYFLEYPKYIPFIWSSYSEPEGCVFAKFNTKIKILGESGPLGKRLLLLNSKPTYKNKDWAEGLGFDVDKIDAIYNTPYQGAKDMIILDTYRRENFEKYGIKNERLKELQRKSKEFLKKAEDAKKEKRWYDFLKFSRQAQAVESRAYPDVKGTANDVVKGIIFYFMLLLPFAYFAERLFFGFPKLEKRIAGVFGIFLIVYWIMRLVHPAFKLTNAPEVILLSFIVLALSAVVLSIVASKFEEQMQRMKRETSRVYETDVGRVTATATAFSLGVANMKRRKVRTILTAITLILLTFTVLSFTSIKSYLKFNQLLRPNKPPYTGVLLRDRSWSPLQKIALEYTKDEFAPDNIISPRGWYILSELGDRTAVEVKYDGKRFLASGILGLSPQENKILPVKRTLIAGKWIERDDEKTILVSRKIASSLGLTRNDIGKATLTVYGKRLILGGIFDGEKLSNLKDMDNEPITPVDFSSMPEKEISKLKMEKTAQVYTSQTKLQSFTHTEGSNIVILPFKTLMRMGGTLQAISVKFSDKVVSPAEAVENFITKLAVILFAGYENKTFVYSSMGLTSFSGLSNLIIPILIAALIVLNTMLGSVYERLREIGTYSAVGLAPVHIASLFLAESIVYAVLGAVSGYLLGQIVAKILMATGLLKGLVLNYSSMSAVFATIIIFITVILSTLYPARKASQMAVPDVTRKWVLPEPEGDKWEFEFPFTVSEYEVLGLVTFLTEYFSSYQDVSLGNFYTNGATLKYEKLPSGKNKYIVETEVWLAPFDLGVSQKFSMILEPLGQYNFYTINLHMKRTSGELNDWKRLNRRFLDGLRKQFLIWRTVSSEIKKDYEKQGKEVLKL